MLAVEVIVLNLEVVIKLKLVIVKGGLDTYVVVDVELKLVVSIGELDTSAVVNVTVENEGTHLMI